MASKRSIEERVKELAAAVLAEEEAEEVGTRHETIDDIENAMVRMGDMLAREIGLQKLARHTGGEVEDQRCADCGHAADRVGEHSREVITRRGKVPVTEAKYRCPKCRRHFFPSDRPAGP